MSSSPCKFTSIGGQAIIEGVMMRSPHFIAVAVRKPNQRIVIRHFPYKGLLQQGSFLRKPLLRGVITLLESMIQGIEALSYSASVAVEQPNSDGSSTEREELSGWTIALSIFSAFVLGMAFFVALPHFLTAVITHQANSDVTAKNPLFHLLDGALRVVILLLYVYLIAFMRDIHRVFQYHGAEHKSIYSFEAGEDLTVENARRHSTLHPRCGTSFLLFLVVISIVVFSTVFPLFNLTELSSNSVLNHIFMVLIKILLMFPVAGVAYEFIKLCASRMDNAIFRTMIWPGLILQRLTTREPDDQQLEVALTSLKQALRLEKGIPSQSSDEGDGEEGEPEEFEIGQLAELGRVHATVAEFPEL